jgi:hypothetical protein
MIRLNPEGWIQLKADDQGLYPLDLTLTVRSWLTHPQSLIQWVDAFSEVSVKPEGTFIRHRLSDGVTDYWWDGFEWTEALDPDLDWNTDAEIRFNMASWQEQRVQVLSNLYTEDRAETPQLMGLKFVMLCDIEVYEDLIYRSLIPELQAGVTPVADVIHEMAAPATEIALSALKTDLDVVGVEAVLVSGTFGNLLDSFDGETITFTEQVGSGVPITFKLKYQMDVIYTYHQDFVQIEELPALVLVGYDTGQRLTPQCIEHVVSGDGSTAIQFTDSIVETFTFNLMAISEFGVDQQRQRQAIHDFIQNKGLIRSVGLDEDFTLVPMPEVETNNRPNLGDYKQVIFPIEVRFVPIYSTPAEDKYVINDFRVSTKVAEQ